MGGKSAHDIQDLSSGTNTGAKNNPITTTENNIFVGEKIFDSKIFLKSIDRPTEPRMINPTDAKSSNRTKVELR